MEYVTPQSASEASQALLQEGAFALAGGTDLLVKLKTRFVSPSIVVDIKRVPKIMTIEQSAEGWWIGAATPCAEIVEHDSLSKDWPGIVEALSLIGSTQIQGRATLGGNLCNASPAADSVPALIAAGATCVVATRQQTANGGVVVWKPTVSMVKAKTKTKTKRHVEYRKALFLL